MSTSPLFSVVALLLFFFVPGFLLMKALWPEWRFRGVKGLERGLTLVAGGVVLSVALTIIIGFYLGNTGLFQAGQGNPLLEEILAAISVVCLIAGWWRGAYSAKAPPESRLTEPPLYGEDDADSFGSTMEQIARDQRRIRHELRIAKRDDPREAERLQGELDSLASRQRAMEREREEHLST
jgi:membrane protein implicated in regulation of membrane protease activity